MAADINDLIGRPSSPSDYAIATTVKTTRSIGVTSLEAYDLSKWATDTPVYFITYKKTVDPATDKVTITNKTGWKALVNADTNTLTNLTLAPGYSDVGNAEGDFIECIPTAYWANDLIDALLVSINQDGSLKYNFLEQVYPIGSIYMNATDSTDPATLFGFGTWVAFGEGRVPVGFDSTQSEFNSTEKTGGAKTHTLTTAQMPSHNHTGSTNSGGSHSHDMSAQYVRTTSSGTQRLVINGSGQQLRWNSSSPNSTGSAGSHSHSFTTANRGDGDAHNNLQPYIVVRMWKRTA